MIVLADGEKKDASSAIQIKKVSGSKDAREFINFQYRLYKDNSCFVPPFRSDIRKMAFGKASPLFHKGPTEKFLAVINGKTAGRIMTGIDEETNKKKNSKSGYITLFECIDDYTAAKALFDTARSWLSERGMTYMRGPVSPTNGDDYKGLLTEGFDMPPTLMNSYNFSYYPGFFDSYGFFKELDLFAYYYDVGNEELTKRSKVVEYAMNRYGYRLDKLDLDNIEREIEDVKKILDIAMPEEWEDMTPPSIEDIRAFATTYRKFADPDFIYIARLKDGTPIGFSLGLPNYNEVFIKMKGRLFPFGFLKLLNAKNRIKSGRALVLFVVPEHRQKGVSAGMLFKGLVAGIEKGYIYGEGSTIGETNLSMRNDAQRAGGRQYKTYRIYGIDI